MRAPFQVLVLPYRYREGQLEVAVFLRSDIKIWQFIAGGGEDLETIVEAAYRELSEEISLHHIHPLMTLDSLCTIPRSFFSESAHWPEELYVVPEHCFAIDLVNFEPVLSEEHLEYRWLNYQEALDLLKWDSNKNALWELRQRLTAL